MARMIMVTAAMVVAVTLAGSAVDATPAWREGKATYYRDGLLERVAARRGIPLGGMSGFATFPDCSRLGWRMWVSVLDPRTGRWSKWEQKRIVDCSQPRDLQRHLATNLIELSYKDAR